MRQAREIVQRIGEQMLLPNQARAASISNVLSMFNTSGLSESERLETGFMIQKMIVEGYLRGVDVPGLMRKRHMRDGALHVGFNDSPIPSGNAIVLDRQSWQSKPDSFRTADFMHKLGSRLTSRPSATPPSSRISAVRHASMARPSTGPMKRSVSSRAMEMVSQQVSRSVNPQVLSHVFQGLQEFQMNMGMAAPQVPQRPQNLATHLHTQAHSAMEGQHESMSFQTRDEMVAKGAMTPMQMQGMNPRSGIGSPRSITSPKVGEMAAQAQATGRPAKMLIYSGSGTWAAEVSDTKQNLDALGIQYEVKNSLSGVDYNQYAAIFMPGGNAGTEGLGIGNSELGRLSAAVNNGLNYLGNCAGAFLAGRSGGNGLNMVNQNIDYVPDYNSKYGGGAQIATPVKLWDGTTRDLMFYGGPGLDGVQGRTLGTFSNGTAGIKSFQQGSGQVILDAFHPGMNAPGDRDGSDDQLMQQLLKAVMAGTDPDGVTTPNAPPGAPPTGNTNNTTNNVYRQPPQINPSAGAMGSTIGSGVQNAGFRKTAVSGMLPEGLLYPQGNPFSGGLSDILRSATPMLGQLGSVAGAIQQKG